RSHAIWRDGGCDPLRLRRSALEERAHSGPATAPVDEEQRTLFLETLERRERFVFERTVHGEAEDADLARFGDAVEPRGRAEPDDEAVRDPPIRPAEHEAATARFAKVFEAERARRDRGGDARAEVELLESDGAPLIQANLADRVELEVDRVLVRERDEL